MIERLSEVSGLDVSRETFDQLTAYVALLVDGSQSQNLISQSSIDDIWERHIVDSAQLIRLAPQAKTWIDIGSGAGLPGVVISILSGSRMTLVEPRALRVNFLQAVIDTLSLRNIQVIQTKAGHVQGRFDAITARAVAPATDLFGQTVHLAHADTVFIFPKGRSATSELELVTRTWQGAFRLEPSVTSDEASILVARNVKPRGKG